MQLLTERTLVISLRSLMSVLFLASGTSKLTSPKTTQEYMESYGVPGYLLYPAAALELSTGTLLMIGLLLMEVGTVLSGWCILTASIFHRDWQGDDGQTQQIMFMKNLCMAGGFLILAAHVQKEQDFVCFSTWAKGRLCTQNRSQTEDAERQSLLSKSMSPFYDSDAGSVCTARA